MCNFPITKHLHFDDSFVWGLYDNVLTNRKEGIKKMKRIKRTVMLLSIALTAFALSACQPTPDKIVVQGKSLDKMIENATKEQTGDSTQGEMLLDKISAKKTYSKELTDANGKVVIHVNAQVIVPDAKEVSVQRVERGAFSQETVDIIREQLVKGELFAGGGEPSKAEIQQQILELEARTLELKALIAQGKDPTAGRYNPEMAEKQIEYMKAQLKTAPDTLTKTPISGKLESFEDGSYSAGDRLLGLAQSEQGGYESLTVYNDYKSSVNLLLYTSEKNAFSTNMGYYVTKEVSGPNSSPSSAEIASMPNISLTKEDAQQKADALIAALGIDYLTCYSNEKAYGGSDQPLLNPHKSVWFLRYVRKVNKIPVTYTTWDCMKVEEDTQSAPWSYEDMTFAIDDSGIVGFKWNSPYKFTEVVTENSNLLAFQDITDVFDTMSLVINAWDGIAQDNPNLTGIEINVDEIRFGLTRITEQDKRDSGLLVPVWDFFGTRTQNHVIDGETKKFDDGPIPILTINAIDGSVINRNLGY